MGESIAPSPSLLLQGDVGMREPQSLLAMYVLAERQTPRPYLVLSKKPPKKINTWFIQNYEKKFVTIF